MFKFAKTCIAAIILIVSLTLGSLAVYGVDSPQTITSLYNTIMSGGAVVATHALVGDKHTASGLIAGQVLRALSPTTFNFGALQTGDLPSGIDAAKIANGMVSNTEFQYLDGVTGAIQGQLTGKEPVISAGTISQYWRGDKSWQTLSAAAVGLGSVENTALSTWGGSSNLATLGTITTGTWHGSAIADSYISSAATWNAKEPTITSGSTGQYWRGDKSWQTLDKTAVGLGSVTNDAQIPLAQKAAASGVASLDGASLVVQNPANASATPTQNKIPIADGVGGKLAAGWIPDLSGTYLPNSSYNDPSWLTGLNASKITTGNGAVTVAAGGSNQNVTLTPSGAGSFVSLGSNRTVASGDVIGFLGTTDAQNIDIGYTLGLGGKFNDAATTDAPFGYLWGRKENGVSGNQNGYLAFGTRVQGAPWVNEWMRITSAGVVLMSHYSDGTVSIIGGNGTLSTSSDERMKDIQSNFTLGLDALKVIQPINFKWNKKSGIKSRKIYIGFSAQNVQKVIPDAIGMNEKGYLSLNDRAVLAAAVNAIKGLNKKVNEQERRIAALEAIVKTRHKGIKTSN